MKNITIHPSNKKINCIFDNIASDKSISHRSVIFSLLSNKKSYISNFLQAEDTISTLNIAKQLGAKVITDGNNLEITPPQNIIEPSSVLDCGNSGTGMRLYSGFLAGYNGSFVLSGDKYLNNRPMKRVTKPLKNIGVVIDGRKNGELAPLYIRGGNLKSFRYEAEIDSAQVKSALILSALQIKNSKSYYRENFLSRDHTERMLKGMGANINISSDGWIEIKGLENPLNPLDIKIPSDPSSAFFFAVAASIVPNSEIIIKNTTLNPTRIEAYKILKKMGAIVNFIEKENIYEPIGDIIVQYNGRLKSVTIEKNIPWLIDELPAISIAMSLADGKSLVKNVKELRVKESDRISTVLEGLKKCEVETIEHPEGYEIIGKKNINVKSINIDSYGDHRIAMSFSILGLLIDIEIQNIECVDTSFPNFFKILDSINS